MGKIKIKLPDNSVKEFEAGVSPYDVAKSIGEGLLKASLAAKVNEKTVDLTYPITDDCDIKIITTNDEEGLEVMRHSAAHLMAQAVSRLFPGTKYAIGPSIKDGFYYDFDSSHVFTPEDLEKIEQEMAKISKEDISVKRDDIPKEEAIKLFDKRNDNYKVEILKELDADNVSIYTQGDFTDLCHGPHVPSTKYVKSFKLLSLAGAYWRGNEKNKQLQRIYGTCFTNDKDLKKYLNKLEEAKKRDHRKIGKELDLFSFQKEGPGFPFWHAKGTILFNKLAEYIRKENDKREYSEIKTPTLLNEELWHKSGHWDNFQENMYFTEIEETTYSVKPMNCPGGLLVYKSTMHSYRELPLKVAELGNVHRHERSGVLHGLFRVRCFTQDDAHIFCTEEQLEEEVKKTVEYILEVYKDFGFENYTVFIATKPEKAIGSDDVWEFSTNTLIKALENMNIPYKIKEGEGAFYGPKIEFNIEDSIERMWQCGTIQVDLSMPGRFDLTYEGSDGQRHTPVMVHRAVFGSLERFIGILIEHFEGKFPLWLAPVQVKILPVTESCNEYAQKLLKTLKEKGIRCDADFRNEKLGYKIRNTQLERVPFMAIIGENEVNSGVISLRDLKGNQKQNLSTEDFIALFNQRIETKSLNINL
jgi:threonyl-tRNA synthetase